MILKSAFSVFFFCRIIKSIDSVFRFSETYEIRDLELGHVFVLFFFNIVIALIDSTLDDWGLQVSFDERSCLVVPIDNGDQYMEIDHDTTHDSFKKSEYREELRKRNPFTALEVLERLTESRKATILLQSVLLNMYSLVSYFFLFFRFYIFWPLCFLS